METRATYGDLGTRGASADFEEVFNQNVNAFDGMDLVGKVLKKQSTNKGSFRDVGIVGYGFLEETAEGDDFPKDIDALTYTTQYTPRDLTKKVTVTDNLIQDGTYGPQLDKFASYARASKYTLGKLSFNVLNTAFVTTAKVNGYHIDRYGDAQELASTVHPSKAGGSSQSNASATSLVLSETNLETGRLALVKQLTDNSLPMVTMGGITLVVPDDLEKSAVIFTMSTKRATTQDNDMNFYVGRINVMTVRWLNSDSGGTATKWHLVSNMSKLKLYVRQEPSFDEFTDGNSRNRTYSVKMRATAGFSDWRGTWHSKGDATAYSG